jgi:hypothetical protein
VIWFLTAAIIFSENKLIGKAQEPSGFEAGLMGFRIVLVRLATAGALHRHPA